MEEFKKYLINNNLANNTISAYIIAIKNYFKNYTELNKRKLLNWKMYLIENYKAKTVNLKIQAMSKYLDFIKKPKLKIKSVKIQQKSFLENVISNADYIFFKTKLKLI